MPRALAQALAGAEGGDVAAPHATLFRRRWHSRSPRDASVFCMRPWHVSCCLCTTRFARPTTLRGTPMEENAGNLIRGLRQKLGMTQEEFAHEIAVTVSTVNRWENAHAEPSKL